MNHYTTIDQAQELIAKGLKPSTADMWYESPDKTFYTPHMGENVSIRDNLFSFREGYVVPCWSFGRLIELMSLKKNVSGRVAALIALSQIMIDNKCEDFTEAAFKGVCWMLESDSARFEDRV